ncbi:hypothetical protein G1H11_21140 [Phytoactinopolyspora alkaliphila]|uniref:Uncharacterized protein n=1 Tax=Phytoactinopolyspora alkaliphila TaxID=1783498 RepID=A0A6N9YSJ9_9ACTN|nr:hypothetical protein [Phytoactinopolyspora alkaliphila]NED97808.1 hypothetical protein [Phytoactinopolyspora alkaliphila]
MSASEIIEDWPEESREAAQLVIDTYGEPHEAGPSLLIWYRVGPWKRIEASKVFHEHNFPVPHIDSVESVIDYHVDPRVVSSLVEFDGSVVVERTAGEVSARCHDEQANFLALNLMHDIVTGRMDVAEARGYYAKEFLDVRRGNPTPYMEGLRFQPEDGSAADPDRRIVSDEELEEAASQGGS